MTRRLLKSVKPNREIFLIYSLPQKKNGGSICELPFLGTGFGNVS